MNRLCQLLERYLKDDLNKEEKLLFESHMVKCAHCRKEVELLREVDEYLNAIPKVKVPDNFSNIVLEKIHQHKKAVAGWYLYGAFAFLSFVAALFAIAAVGVNSFVNNFVFLGKSLYNFASSLLTAVVTLSGSLYNALTPGKVNGIVLTMAFVIIFLVFLKSIKLFSSVER